MNNVAGAASNVWQSSRGAGRSRIVVDLEREEFERAARQATSGHGDYVPPGGAKRRGCFGKILGGVLGVILLVALLVGVGGYLLWRNYQSNPVYSLALLADAAQRDDRAAFDELIDARLVARGFLPQVRQQATGNMDELPPAIGRQVEAAVEQQLPNIEGTVRESLRATIGDVARQMGGNVPFPLLVLAVRGLASDVRVAGQTASLNMNLGGQEPSLLTMQRRGERWQLVGVRDPRIAASLAAQLPPKPPGIPAGTAPATGGALERELQRRMQQRPQR